MHFRVNNGSLNRKFSVFKISWILHVENCYLSSLVIYTMDNRCLLWARVFRIIQWVATCNWSTAARRETFEIIWSTFAPSCYTHFATALQHFRTYFRYGFQQQQLWLQLVAVGVTLPSTCFWINAFWGGDCCIHPYSCLIIILARPDDISSRTLAFDALNYGI